MKRDAPATKPTADEAKRREIGELFQPFAPRYVASPAEAFYLRAHQEAPVAYSPAFFAHLVTGYAEVLQVLRDPVLFSSANNLDPVVPFPDEVVAELQKGWFPLAPALFNNDPPGHTRSRALFAKAFTPVRIGAMEPKIRQFAAEIVDQLLARGEPGAELMRDIAFPLPMRVIAELVGVPPEDMPTLKSWQDDLFRMYEPTMPLEQKLVCARNFVEYQRYYADLIERRRAAPTDDLVSALIRARVDGEHPFTTAEIISHLVILLFAGYETTASLVGSLMHHLLSRRPLWHEIGGDSALLAAAIEETVRLDAPVQMEPRRTTAATTVGGVELPAGATLFVFFGAGNYDPEQFADPLAFDPRRHSAARHIGFGWGVHSCLGAPLGRLETRVMVETLRQRLPSLRLADGAARNYLPSMFFRTPAAIPVSWDR